jgi:hypothetical protein
LYGIRKRSKHSDYHKQHLSSEDVVFHLLVVPRLIPKAVKGDDQGVEGKAHLHYLGQCNDGPVKDVVDPFQF